MKRILILASVALILVASGCGTDEDSFNESSNSLGNGQGVVEQVAVESSIPSEAQPLTERLIIRSASLELVVRDTQAVQTQINQWVNDLGGYVVTSQLTKYEEGIRINMTVRVPAETLDATLAQLRDWALEVRAQNVSGQDVTEEYSDLQAQLRHLQATEEQLLIFLEEAEDTEATLSVYTELQRIQGEIERTKGRIQYLEQASALSSVNVTLIPDALARPVSIAGWRPQGTLRRAFEALVGTLQFLIEALIWVLVYLLPVALLVLGPPLAALLWLVRRRRKARE
jgi:hypothetical protein